MRSAETSGGNPGDGGGVLGGTFYDCVISNNVSKAHGGGLCGGWTGTGASGMRCPVVAYRCLIAGNRSVTGGGAYSENEDQSLCSFYDCKFSSNSASSEDAGALYRGYASNCVFQTNSAGRYGGALRKCTAQGCQILANASASAGGGAMESILEDCLLQGNVSNWGSGGAAYNSTTRRCVVTGNKAGAVATLCRGYHEGDVVYFNKARTRDGAERTCAAAIGADVGGTDCAAVNCTIYWNEGGEAAVAYAAITNCIIWGQGGQTSFKNLTGMGYCLTRDTENALPDFAVGCRLASKAGFLGDETTGYTLKASVEASVANLGLRTKSLGFNAGLTLPNLGAIDLLGNPRVKYDSVDMGAFECCAPLGSTLLVR